MATESGGFDALRSAFDRFDETLDATTVPAEGGGGRVVGGIPHAVALSEATDALYGELGATYGRLIQQHGQPIADYYAGIVPKESDSLDGPWPGPGEVCVVRMGIGGNGADAMLLAALENANKVAAFPIGKWNEMQAARPGANHRRFHAGEVVSAADLSVLESAAKMLRMAAVSKQSGPPKGGGDNGAKPATPPDGDGEAIDERDVMILAFLNRKPGLRRRATDVLPEDGPQDRKAIGLRLRKLADRTPPLVDYPKQGKDHPKCKRSGVAILPAGVDALRRAT